MINLHFLFNFINFIIIISKVIKPIILYKDNEIIYEGKNIYDHNVDKVIINQKFIDEKKVG